MSDRLQDLASGKAEPKGRGFGGWIAGRCRRREYWLWVAPLFAAMITVSAFAPAFALVLGWPLLFVWIRRLHDLGLSGWFAPLINIGLAIIGWIEVGVMSPGGDGGVFQGLISLGVLVGLGLWPGQPGPNAYGPPPGRHKSDLAETFG